MKNVSRNSLVRLLIGRTAERSPPSARQILDARYARGEIEREEYLRRLEDLKL